MKFRYFAKERAAKLSKATELVLGMQGVNIILPEWKYYVLNDFLEIISEMTPYILFTFMVVHLDVIIIIS